MTKSAATAWASFVVEPCAPWMVAWPAPIPARNAAACRARRLRPGRRDVERAVVVGAGGELNPARMNGLDPVPFGERRQESRLDRRREPARELVRLLRPRPVPSLPDGEEQQHPLDVRHGQRRPHPVERVRQRVGEAALAEERDQLVDRRPARLQVAVVLLAQVPDEHVQRHGVLGELGRDLDREERVREVRDPQRTLDRVVVGDRDEGHATRLAGAVDALGLRVRLAELGAAERVVAAVRRVDRVDVQVAAVHCSRCSPSRGRFLPFSGAFHPIVTGRSPQCRLGARTVAAWTRSCSTSTARSPTTSTCSRRCTPSCSPTTGSCCRRASTSSASPA